MEIICPYCEKELDINHDDGFGYEEGVLHHQECPYCENLFVFETTISFYYEPFKAECLNGGKHDYKITNTCPKEFSQMECSMCGGRRDLTNAERIEFNIGSKESYFESLK